MPAARIERERGIYAGWLLNKEIHKGIERVHSHVSVHHLRKRWLIKLEVGLDMVSWYLKSSKYLEIIPLLGFCRLLDTILRGPVELRHAYRKSSVTQ